MEPLQGYYSGLLSFLNALLQEIPSVSTSPEESQYLMSQILETIRLINVQTEAVHQYANKHRQAA